MASKDIEVRTGITVFPCTHSDDIQELYCENLVYHVDQQVGDHCVYAAVIKHPEPHYIGNVGDALINMMKKWNDRRMMFMIMYGIDINTMDDLRQIFYNIAYDARAMDARPYFFIVDDKEGVFEKEPKVDMRKLIEDPTGKVILKV